MKESTKTNTDIISRLDILLKYALNGGDIITQTKNVDDAKIMYGGLMSRIVDTSIDILEYMHNELEPETKNGLRNTIENIDKQIKALKKLK